MLLPARERGEVARIYALGDRVRGFASVAELDATVAAMVTRQVNPTVFSLAVQFLRERHLDPLKLRRDLIDRRADRLHRSHRGKRVRQRHPHRHPAAESAEDGGGGEAERVVVLLRLHFRGAAGQHVEDLCDAHGREFMKFGASRPPLTGSS